MPYAGVFDLHETLITAGIEFKREWTRRALGTKRCTSDAEAARFLDLGREERRNYLKRIGFHDPEEYFDLWLADDAIDARLNHSTIYDDAEALCDLKMRGCRIGIVAHAPERLGRRELAHIEDKLESPGLFDEAVFIHGSCLPRKPHPAGLLLCLDKLGVETGAAFYCGNLDRDVLMGQNAGMAAYKIDRGGENLYGVIDRFTSTYARTCVGVPSFSF